MKLVYIIVIALSVFACGNGKLNEPELIEKAKVSIERGEYKPAIIYLKNVLQENPNNVESRWLLGGVHLEMYNGAAAEKELKKALKLGISSDAAKPMLLKALMSQGKYDKIIAMDVDDLQVVSNVSDALVDKGVAHYFKREFKLANKYFTDALTTEPDSAYALAGKALIGIAKRDFNQAQSDVELALKNDSEDAFVWGVAGDLAQETSDYTRALMAYSKALNYQKYNSAYLIKRVFLNVRIKKYQEAQLDINTLKKRFADSSQVSYAQGVLYFHQEKFEKAQVELENALKFDGNNEWAKYYLGVSQFMLSKLESAQNNLGAFVAAHPNFMPGLKFLALIKMRENEYQKAEDIIRPVLKRNSKDVFALSILANSLLKQGRASESVRLFEEVVELKPKSAGGYLKLGVGLLTEGKQARGFENLEKAVDITPDFEPAQIILILGYIKESKFIEAKKAAQLFVAKQPENVIAYNLLGRVFMADSDEKQAFIQFQKAQKLKLGDPESNIFLGAIAMEKGAFDEAENYLNETLKYHPKHMHTLINLAALKAKEGDRKGVKDVLLSVINFHPEAVQPRLLLAGEYLKDGNSAKGVLLLNEIKEANWSDLSVTTLLVELQMSLGRFSDAQSILRQAMLVQPERAINHMLLAKIYSGLKNVKGMRLELDAALKLEPSLLEGRLMMTRLMLSLNEVAAAAKNLRLLKKYDKRGRLNLLSLEGRVFEKEGKLKKAEEKFDSLYGIYGENRNAMLSLSRFQWRIGKKEESINTVLGWLKKHPSNVEVMLELANNYLVLGQKQDAIKQYKKVLDLSGNNLIALNNLAFNLKRIDASQALNYAKKARAIAPKSLMVMDTLVAVLLELGQVNKALELARQLVERKPGNLSYRLRLASAQEKSGKYSEAVDSLKIILANKEAFPQRDLAQKMLKSIQGK